MEETEATPLPDDVIREILLRVPTVDVVALFRCAVTCKQWRAVVADPSFLRHHWPDNGSHSSSLLGFVDRRYDDREPPYFCPVSSPGSVLGSCRHSLASFVHGTPGGILDDAVPLAARGGLLLVRLVTGRITGDFLHLAVCDILTGTYDELPPLECRVLQCRCAILAREDCCSLDEQQGRTRYSAFFKVLAMVIGTHNADCNLYTFSSSEPNWSEPRKCFDEVLQRDTFGLRILMGINRGVVCRGVTYWLGSYSTEPWSWLPHYFTFGVNVETGQISLTELSIPTNQLSETNDCRLMLSVAVDGNLSLFHLQKEGLGLDTWRREDDETWVHNRVIELKPPEHAWYPFHVAMWSGEKSGALFVGDAYGRAYKIDPETGVDVTAEMFQDILGIMAVPIEIDWRALFMSRLASFA